MNKSRGLHVYQCPKGITETSRSFSKRDKRELTHTDEIFGVATTPEDPAAIHPVRNGHMEPDNNDLNFSY